MTNVFKSVFGIFRRWIDNYDSARLDAEARNNPEHYWKF